MKRQPLNDWAQRLQALAQNGLAFTQDSFDRERYEQIREIALEMAAAQHQLPPAEVSAAFAGETGYATPKVDVRGVVFRDGCILLVRERADGGWTLPGGWVDVGDSPREAVEREVREESGYQVRAAKLLAVYDRSRHAHPPHLHYIYKLFIRCEIIGGAAAGSLETDGVGFFPLDALPPLSLDRITPGQIARMGEHLRNPELPADFD